GAHPRARPCNDEVAADNRHTTALLGTSVAVAALAATVLAPAPAVSADAVPPPGAYYVQSAVTGLNAADSGGVIEQHRPRGNEDRQQWRLGADGTLESADAPGACLDRKSV